MKIRENETVGQDIWPAISQPQWSETCSTLQLWMQVIGKVRLALMPPLNHCWSVTLYPAVRGLTTSIMPYGNRTLQIDFDFVDHRLCIDTSDGQSTTIVLGPIEVAVFYQRVMVALGDLGMPVHIWSHPVEVEQPIPFEEDYTHKAYDPESAQHFWRILLQTSRVFSAFRSRFVGKVSPVHLFWGALDLACTRFSGRTAPEHPSMPGLPDRVTRDAYSHEVSSCGFWPGTASTKAMFYSYAYPEPPGYRESLVKPAQASFDRDLGEFALAYEAVMLSADPDATLLEFLQSTYEAAASRGQWDRASLETGEKRLTS